MIRPPRSAALTRGTAPARLESPRPVGPITITTSIDAPRERVFDFICDLATRPSWIDHFADDYRVERIPASGRGAAARFRVDAPAGSATWRP